MFFQPSEYLLLLLYDVLLVNFFNFFGSNLTFLRLNSISVEAKLAAWIAWIWLLAVRRLGVVNLVNNYIRFSLSLLRNIGWFLFWAAWWIFAACRIEDCLDEGAILRIVFSEDIFFEFCFFFLIHCFFYGRNLKNHFRWFEQFCFFSWVFWVQAVTPRVVHLRVIEARGILCHPLTLVLHLSESYVDGEWILTRGIEFRLAHYFKCFEIQRFLSKGVSLLELLHFL